MYKGRCPSDRREEARAQDQAGVRRSGLYQEEGGGRETTQVLLLFTNVVVHHNFPFFNIVFHF